MSDRAIDSHRTQREMALLADLAAGLVGAGLLQYAARPFIPAGSTVFVDSTFFATADPNGALRAHLEQLLDGTTRFFEIRTSGPLRPSTQRGARELAALSRIELPATLRPVGPVVHIGPSYRRMPVPDGPRPISFHLRSSALDRIPLLNRVGTSLQIVARREWVPSTPTFDEFLRITFRMESSDPSVPSRLLPRMYQTCLRSGNWAGRLMVGAGIALIGFSAADIFTRMIRTDHRGLVA